VGSLSKTSTNHMMNTTKENQNSQMALCSDDAWKCSALNGGLSTGPVWCGTRGVAKSLFGGAFYNSRLAGPSTSLSGGGDWPLIGGQTTVEKSGDRNQPTSVSEGCGKNGEITSKVTIDLRYEKASTEVPKTREDLTRYTLTNSGTVTTPQMYSALQNSLRRNPLVYDAIVKVIPVSQPTRRNRFDIWIKNEYAAGLQVALKLDYMGRKKLAEEIKHSNLSYEQLIMEKARDAVIQIPKVVKETQQSNPCNLATWNVNGINSKLPAVRSYMVGNSLAIMGIQEHLRTINPYVPGIREYVIFEKPREKGFRGHCLYVHQHLAAHEVSTPCRNIIHIKVFGLTGQRPWNIVSVYMPSGTSQRTARNKVWGEIETTLKSLTSIEDPLITLMGDLNDDTVSVTKKLSKGAFKLLNLAVANDPTKTSTRNLKDKEGRYLDHVIHSPAARSLVDKTQVDDVSFDISDHWPVLIKTNLKNVKLMPTKKVWNRKHIVGHGRDLALSNRWDTKNLVKQSRKARALYNTALLENDHVNLPGLRKSMEEKGRRVKLLRSARVNKTLVKNEGANFHRTVQTAQGKRLHTPRVWHQTQLVSPRTHVPKKNCGGPRKLLHIHQACDTLDEEEDGEVDGVALPNKLDAQAFLQAIRQIQRNSAPGKSGVLAIHLKKFLEVECQLQISKDWKDPEMDWYGDKCYPKPIDHSVASAGGANDPSIDPSPQHHAGVHTAENSASTLE
ncbi:hypothetical protein PSHT_13643, partial [Puccinia striiformis]